MKTSSAICLTLILSISLASNAEAAKENFDRSKPHVRAGNGLDNDCNGKKATSTTKALAGSQQGDTTQSPRCVKPMTPPAPSLMNRPLNDIQSGGTRATDYNSSRSNKRGVKQDGDDLVLRKRPGRTKFTPPGNCPTPVKGEKSQTKPNCLAKKQ